MAGQSRDFLLFCCCLHLVPVCWLIAVPLCSFGIIQMIISQPIEKMNTEVSTLISIYTIQTCLLYYSTQVNDDNSIATLCKEGNLLCYINQ